MRKAVLILAALLAAPIFGQAANPLVGRWDFTVTTQRGTSATWLGITEKAGAYTVWYQPSGGNCYEVKNFKVDGSHISIVMSPATDTRPAQTLELDAAGDKIGGVTKRGDNSTPIAGVRAPELNRPAPAAWTDPEPLFNGKDLTGWVPIGNVNNNHWVVKDGLLLNEDHGANLKSTRTFDDFKVHFEVKCPDGGNSGFYLRGRYETQIEYEPLTENPPERRIGSIYGRITPKDIPRTPGQWETFDVTLVGRTVTIVRNGVLTVDHQVIDGITGGALDANEGDPGPFYIQGDHTGGLAFRNITVSVPKR
jgi:hypothetical protein